MASEDDHLPSIDHKGCQSIIAPNVISNFSHCDFVPVAFTNTPESHDSAVLQITNPKSTVNPVISSHFENHAKCELDTECKPDTHIRPLIRSSFTFEITRKRSRLESDTSPSCDTPSVPTPLKRQTSSTSNGSVNPKPSASSTLIEVSRPNSIHSIKRPSSLPIPSQMFSSVPDRAREVGDANIASMTKAVPRTDQNTVTVRNFLSGRRILINSTTPLVPTRQEWPTLQPEEQLNPSNLPPSPKRQRSLTKSPANSSPALLHHRGLTLHVPNADLTASALHRREELLHPTKPVYEDVKVRCSDSHPEEQWPPLVVDVYSRITLLPNPSKILLLNLLSQDDASRLELQFTVDSCNPAQKLCSSDLGHTDGGSYKPDNSRSAPTSANSLSNNELHSPNCLTPRTRPGLTLAVTRNVHVHVHATQLDCCLRKPAWCFTSFGLQSYGQQELVLLVQRRSDEQLPPLSIYRFYQQLYLAVSSGSTEAVKGASITLMPSDQPTAGLFHAYDTFIPRQFFPHHSTAISPQPISCCTDVDQTGPFDDCSATHPFGCLFYHPTHQCLVGLQLPATPFLMGLLFSANESYWAHHLPLRLLLRLGMLTRQYPTPLLCDLDREPPLFDSRREVGLLPWLSMFTVPPSDSAAAEHKERTPPPPALLLRVPGLHIRLISSKQSDPQLPGAKLELSIPTCQQSMLCQFLENSPGASTVFAVAGDLDPNADSHLVCIQPTAEYVSSLQLVSTEINSATVRPFQSSAISIANTVREVTGASFVIFIMSNSLHARVSMVEDGVFVQLPSDSFAQLVQCFITTKNVRFDIPDFALKDSLVSCVTISWEGEMDRHESCGCAAISLSESNRIGWIDMKCLRAEQIYLVPIHYQLVHWLQPGLWLQSDVTNQTTITTEPQLSDGLGSQSSRLAWARLHVLRLTNTPFLEKHSGKPLNLGELADQACGAIIQSLRSHVDDLRRHNHTQLAVRIHLQPPDQVGYQVVGLHSELAELGHSTNPTSFQPSSAMSREEQSPDNFSSKSPDPHSYLFDLERYLIPVMQTWMGRIDFQLCDLNALSSSSLNTTVIDKSPQLVFELHFYLLD